MRSEDEIKRELKIYKKSFAHRDMSNPLDRLVGSFDKIWIEALEWVLQEFE
jgi:hypothetical protein